jgi:hypothetical protein
MEAMQRDANLLQVVQALGAGRGVAHFLHGRDQKRNQDRDDGNHHEELDERECLAGHGWTPLKENDSSESLP